MRAFDIAQKNFIQMLRDWKFAMFLFIMPIAFTLLMGFVFSGGRRGDQDPRLPVAYQNQDGDPLSGYLLQSLGDSQIIRLEELAEDANLEQLVEDEDLAAALIVPAGYSMALWSGQPMNLILYVDPASSNGFTVQNEIQSVVQRLRQAITTAQISVQVYDGEGQFSDGATRQEYLEQTVERTLAAWREPPLGIKVSQAVESQPEETQSNPYSHSSPGMLVQFSIAGLIAAAEVVVIERKARLLNRMLTTPIRRVEILGGHFLTMFGMIFLQVVVLTLFGQLFLDLDYYRDPLAILMIILTATFFTASLGLLIGTLAKTEDQVVLLTLIPMFVLAGLGGAWVSLEVTPEAVQFIGHLMPTAWMMDGFKGILVRGWGAVEMIQPALILMGYAIVCFAGSLWKFYQEG
jgi:ABC-2 type transport system permease protein